MLGQNRLIYVFVFFNFIPFLLFQFLAIRSLHIGPQMSYLVCGQNACYSPKKNLATAASTPSFSVIDDVRCHVITLDQLSSVRGDHGIMIYYYYNVKSSNNAAPIVGLQTLVDYKPRTCTLAHIL